MMFTIDAFIDEHWIELVSHEDSAVILEAIRQCRKDPLFKGTPLVLGFDASVFDVQSLPPKQVNGR
jgi:hypothetical protein